MPTITERALAATIDHAILKPELTRTDVDAELDIAAEWKVFSVCVRPSDIPHAVERLAGRPRRGSGRRGVRGRGGL